MNRKNLPFPSNDGADYRQKLLSEVFEKTQMARQLIEGYKALCLCLLTESADDYSFPEFLQDMALEQYYGEVPQVPDRNFVDEAIDLADDMMGYDAFDDNGPYEHALFKRADFPTSDPHQLWVYYMPNAIFYEMGLCLSGRIPAGYDSNEPHVFDSFNKNFSNKALEKKLEIAEYMIEFLEPIATAMIDFLKERLDIKGDCHPAYFSEIIRRAKSEGYDISEPLQSDVQYTWFDRFWHQVVDELTDIQNANEEKWDFDFPDGAVLQ